MSETRRHDLERICQAALDRDPHARSTFLAEACAGDDALRRDAESLLAQEPAAADFMEVPFADMAAESVAAERDAVIGRSIGPYRVVSWLGAGGMGEVYRARDTTLDRDVALKVLPGVSAQQPDWLARFRREAKVLATLNHPNIAAIYGLEESNHVLALALELVEGPTLADRLAQSAIPLDEALPIAMQIAEAMEAAHERGVVHRDLTPANIKLRPDGVVKVLDFGLAKAIEPTGERPANVLPSAAITDTQARMIFGTAAYVSPEQARGRAVDKRSDVWAFGCVLYEMLNGRRAFDAEDVSTTLSKVIEREPEWNALPANTPGPIHKLLRRCLEKDAKRRLRDIGEARLMIEEALTASASAALTPVALLTPGRRHAAAIVGVVALGAAVLWGASAWFVLRPAAPRVARLTISPIGAAALSFNDDRILTITSDGRRVIYVGDDGRQIFVRPIDQLEPATIISSSNTSGLRGLFASPDGHWVGFVQTNSTLKKVGITGGTPATLVAMDGPSRGATWLADETIVFATGNLASGLQRVPAVGGGATVLTRPNRDRGEADHVWPEQLPEGRGVLFTILPTSGGPDAAQVAVLDLATGTQTTLVRGGSHAQYVVSGHLVYIVGETLRAVPFDLARLAVHGTSMQVVPRLATSSLGGGHFAVAADGTLVYADTPGGSSAEARMLVWVDRQGREEALGAPPRPYRQPRISPDGTRIVMASADQQRDLWRWDLPRGPLTRLTSDPGLEFFPVWTKDGRRVVFASQPGGGPVNLFWQAVEGTGAPERLADSENSQSPTAITPDGSQVVFHQLTTTRGTDLRLQSLKTDHRGVPLLETRFDEGMGEVSPDGRWLAYQSNSSETFEVYVRPFANGDERQWLISTAGGTNPLWAPSGRELYYVAPDGTLMAVPVEPRNAVWRAGSPAKVVEGRYVVRIANSGRNYDVSPDGQRFLMLKQVGAAALPQLIVVQHWVEELKRLVPTK